MKKLIRQAMAFLLCAALLCPGVYAAETAATIKLTKTEGTVTVSKSNGKSVTMRADMRLYNGYNVTTAAESYAWINLDSSKLMKLDASSSVEVRKNGSKLEVNVKSGGVSFDVSEKLSSGESLNVSTSTMSVGIRGTCGWARVTDQWVSEICLLEGSSQCVVADPVTNQIKSAQLAGGDTAQCVVYPQEKPGDKCDILMERQSTGGIPGFVLTELVQDVGLCDKILDDSGLDVLADLAKEAGGDPSGRSPDGKSASPEVLGRAEQVRSREESQTAQKQEEIRKEEESQEHNISKDPVWEQGQQPSDTGSTGGGSSGGTGTPPAPVTYTVTFNANGGEVSPDSAVTGTDGKLTTLPTPTREGHTFGGWYTAADGGEQITAEQVFTADTTVYALWTLNRYTVTFNSQGGSDVAEATVDHGGTVNVPTDPERTGYTFDGWCADTACENAWDFDSDTVTGAVTLYAKWTLNRYWVSFDSQKGSAVESVEVLYGNTVTDPGDPTRTGYTFGGWYKEAACENKWDFDSNTVPANNVTLYAKWTLNRYWVSFDSQEGSAVESVEVLYGNTVTDPGDPTRTGYTFGGWYKEAACENKWDFDTGTVTGAVTLYAKWTLNRYTVTFNSQGGSDVAEATVDHGGTVNVPTDPERTGYTFDGWCADTECTTPWDFSKDTVSGNTTLYAKWTAITYEIYFDSQGGSEVVTQNVDYSEKITPPAAPTRVGYTFGGWHTDEACTTEWDFDSNTVSGNMTLYAKWTLNQYTVTFNSRGGSAVTAAQVDHGSKVTQPDDPSQGVYKFDGWCTDYACTNPWDFNTPVTKNMTLYAKWIPYTITFDINSFPSPTSTPATADADNSGKLKSIRWLSSRDSNCIFTGWYTEPTGGEEVTTSTVFDSNQTVYAHWYRWELNEGTLTISGIGDMPDFTFNSFPWYSDKANITKVVIENGLTSIGNYAFYFCNNITSVTIPNGVTSIGDSAFYRCENLTKVTIPDGVTSIGDSAFYWCEKMTEIVIPDSVKNIEKAAFFFCRSLSSFNIPSGVTSIASSTFANCSGLTSFTIPDRVTSIGGYAFAFCTGLTSINIPANVTSIGDEEFAHCKDDLTITVDPLNEHFIVENGVLFDKNKTRLLRYQASKTNTSYNIPDSVKTIDTGAFINCKYLTSITIPAGVDSIGNRDTFSGCANLTSIIIPSGVTSICDHAFNSCTNLTSVTIPASVTNIGSYVFNSCGKLTEINYGGTKAQWNKITINSTIGLSGKTVICTDGNITIS